MAASTASCDVRPPAVPVLSAVPALVMPQHVPFANPRAKPFSITKDLNVTALLTADGALADPYRNFIAVSRYARWLDDEGRRETWMDTVDRLITFWAEFLRKRGLLDSVRHQDLEEIRQAILDHSIMPSMRALMTAGPALERSHIAAYNCSFIGVNHPRAFDEALYVLLNGTGVGFSVERRHIDQLPIVPAHFRLADGTVKILVADSKEGWAQAYQDLLSALWNGQSPQWDMSQVRPAGARLKTFGGRASGPGPLDALFRFTVTTFKNAAGRRLTPLECHDLMCKVGDIVVVGGVRRSALISLSDLNDFAMAKAKSGTWWEDHGHRALANNSAAYVERPPVTQFLREWRNLIESQSGERGVWNLAGARTHAARTGRDGALIEGTNPCGEILLRDMEFCNLTEVVLADDDDEYAVARKVRLATMLGTLQSMLTEFPYLRPQWRTNCEQERLLGVSLTGIYGHPLFNNPDDPDLPWRLETLRAVARGTNAEIAAALGINPAASITCVKPSGTVSQLTGVSSGIHPWHSPFYLRTVRAGLTDPLTTLMMDSGIPHEPDVMKPDDTVVFSFPVKAPQGAVTRDQVSALDHLRLWSIYREHWTEHNPSVTINVRESEWMAVGTWVYENWDRVGGVAFLPYSEHVYQQPPYQAIDEAAYDHAVEAMPTEMRWADLALYELMDTTTGSRELACSADGTGCEVVDIVT